MPAVQEQRNRELRINLSPQQRYWGISFKDIDAVDLDHLEVQEAAIVTPDGEKTPIGDLRIWWSEPAFSGRLVSRGAGIVGGNALFYSLVWLLRKNPTLSRRDVLRTHTQITSSLI